MLRGPCSTRSSSPSSSAPLIEVLILAVPAGSARHLDRPARTGLLLPRGGDGGLPGPGPRRRAGLRGAARRLRGGDPLRRRDGDPCAAAHGRLRQPHRDGLGRLPCDRGDPRQRRLPLRFQRRDIAIRQPAADRPQRHRSSHRGCLAGRACNCADGTAVAGRGVRSVRRPLDRSGLGAARPVASGADRAGQRCGALSGRGAARHRTACRPGGHRAALDEADGSVATRQRRPGRRRGGGRPLALGEDERTSRRDDRDCLRRGVRAGGARQVGSAAGTPCRACAGGTHFGPARRRLRRLGVREWRAVEGHCDDHPDRGLRPGGRRQRRTGGPDPPAQHRPPRL